MTKGHPLAATPPMEAKLVASLPEEPGWQFEPKWDGFRAIVSRAGNATEIMSKSGKSLARYFPEIVALLAGTPSERFVVDGELILPINGALSF
jgi:ATP-dependent DNA ligase